MRGLDLFKRHFAPYADRYVLIGGTACTVVMDDAGLDFRATIDLDIVLHVQALDADFAEAFWTFVRAGGYEHRQKSTGQPLFYRFEQPGDETFPFMLELFSRVPDALYMHGEGHLTPIPIDEEISSLSAILLEEDYYRFIHQSTRQIGGRVGMSDSTQSQSMDGPDRPASGRRPDRFSCSFSMASNWIGPTNRPAVAETV